MKGNTRNNAIVIFLDASVRPQLLTAHSIQRDEKVPEVPRKKNDHVSPVKTPHVMILQITRDMYDTFDISFVTSATNGARCNA